MLFKATLMKVLHLIDSFDARFDRDQIKLVELLEEKGYQNTVVTSRYSSDWKFIKEAEFREWERRFVQTKILHQPSLRIPTPFSKALSPIYLPSREVLHSFNLIHAYTFGTYSSLLGATLKRIRKFRLVLRSDMSSATYYKAKSAPFYRRMLTYPFRIADAVYAYSNLEKRYLVDLGIQGSKIRVIPVGIDLDEFSRNEMVQKKEKVTIGYLGRFCVVKGIHTVVPALSTILSQETKVRVVFTGVLEDVKYAEDVIGSLKKFKNFEYLSGSRITPIRFYNMCDIILVPSIWETGAITVLEAMACGKAVIGSNINPIREYIHHNQTGFLFSGQREVYVYLKKMIENPGLIDEIGNRARKEVKKYDWKVVIRRYEEMYRSVVKQNSQIRNTR